MIANVDPGFAMLSTMRYVLGCLLAGAIGLLVLKSSDLHSRFGEPTAETFNVGPRISLTVQYGSDRLVCQALIDPPQPLLHGEVEAPYMSSEEVSKIVEEIAPEEVRGKELGRIITNGGCNQFTIVEYDNVVITRSTHNCLLCSRTAKCEQPFGLSVMRAPGTIAHLSGNAV